MKWRKKVKNQQLSIGERWKSDTEYYEKHGNMLSIPICKSCIHNNYDIDVYHCEKYVEEKKPVDVYLCRKGCIHFKSKFPINIEVKNEFQSKLYGGIWGFILGDAMGVPVEFSKRVERENDPVKEMRAYGTHHQYFGTWSDDTSLMLCLIQNLTEGYSLKKLATLFVRYLDESYLTPMNEVFDIGISTRKAIEKFKSGTPPELCGGKSEYDNGNGSLMRILPLVFYLKDAEPIELIRMIKEVSSLTHQHKRSVLGCIIYIEYAIQLLEGKNKNEAYCEMINFIKCHCENDYGEEFHYFKRILTNDLLKLENKDIKSSGYIVDTLEAVLWSFMITDDYTQAIITAINLGDDTDTIGALTGGIAGIYYGYESIPENWLQYLLKKQEIMIMIQKFEEALSDDM